jgi:hypothetical protein
VGAAGDFDAPAGALAAYDEATGLLIESGLRVS